MIKSFISALAAFSVAVNAQQEGIFDVAVGHGDLRELRWNDTGYAICDRWALACGASYRDRISTRGPAMIFK